MTSILQTDSWVETESCDGPRRTRNAPSRENGGVLMTEIQDKYITEFELPYRNIERYIKEIGNNWDRLDDKQRQLIKKSFQGMGMNEKMNDFKEGFGSDPVVTVDSTVVDPTIASFIKYLSRNTTNNPQKFMDTLWNPDPDQMAQMAVTKNDIDNIKDSMYQWSVDNSYVMHSNWRSGLILFFFMLIIIILIIIIAAAAGEGGVQSASFGRSFSRSLFGKH